MDLPQLVACLDVENRHGEEDYGEQQHQSILHRKFLSSDWKSASRVSRLKNLPLWAAKPICARSEAGRSPCTSMILACARFEYRKDFLSKP
jgi:hypothetical protein